MLNQNLRQQIVRQSFNPLHHLLQCFGYGNKRAEGFAKQEQNTFNPHVPNQLHHTAVQLHKLWGCTSTSYMTLNPANSIFFEQQGEAYLAYRLYLGVAITVGSPVGSHPATVRCVRQFLNFCRGQHWLPVFFAVENNHAIYRELKLKEVQVAEDAYLELEQLEFRGKNWQDVRTALNRAGRETLRFCQFKSSQTDAVAIHSQLEQLSVEWLQTKKLPELCFMLGSTDTISDPVVRTFYAINSQGQVEGFVTWLPFFGERGGWSLDLMRRKAEAMPGIMEFLIASSALQFKAEGCVIIGLGAAPLAPIQCQRSSSRVEHFVSKVSSFLSPFYHFDSLFAFKRKFRPEWRPLYMFYQAGNSLTLPRIGLALISAYLSCARCCL